MRVVYLTPWYSEGMGYAENKLPKALARAGIDMHLVTSDLQVYPFSETYSEVYEPFLGPPRVEPCEKVIDGYRLHRLPSRRKALLRRYSALFGPSQSYLSGLVDKLRELQPDVIHMNDTCLHAYRTVWAFRNEPCKLFLEFHKHKSVMAGALAARDALIWRLYRRMVGNFLSRHIEACFPISTDAAEVAAELYGIDSAKIQVMPLGVDTDWFHPPRDEADAAAAGKWRAEWGVEPDEIVVVYTGRFTAAKGPAILAAAVDRLRADDIPVRAVFFGAGEAHETAKIKAARGCLCHDFVQASELPAIYRAADVGVWPRQESLSQLDMLASGRPIVISADVQATERVDGCGLTYTEGDPESLAEQLRRLRDPHLRAELGAVGEARIAENYSWDAVARQLKEIYAEALEEREAP